jgi:hypothetical protein
MEKMMVGVQAEVTNNQAKADVNLKAIKEEMMARLKKKVDADEENMIAKLDAHHQRTTSKMHSQLGKIEAC